MAYIVTAKLKKPNAALCFVSDEGLYGLSWRSNVKTYIPKLFETFEQARGVLNRVVMAGMEYGWLESYNLAVSDPKILEK